MNDLSPDLAVDPSPPPNGADWPLLVRELERRITALEGRVAELQDTAPLEERITDRVVTRLPKPAPPPDPSRPPSLADLALPLPSAAAVTTAVQSTWLLWDLVSEARNMFWMLADRRYTKAWLTRVLVILFLVMIFTSGLWFPFTRIELLWIGYVIDRVLVILLTLAMGLVLGREACRYREWRAGRR